MRSLIKFLFLVFILFISGLSYSQTKSQVHLGIGSSLLNISTASGNSGITGSLYNNFSSGDDNNNSNSSSSFSFLVGYFPVNKLRIDGGFGINAFERTEPAIYFNLGSRYFYFTSKNKKTMLNGGISANFGITTGTERYVSNESAYYSYYSESERKKPVNLSIVPIEFQRTDLMLTSV